MDDIVELHNVRMLKFLEESNLSDCGGRDAFIL